MNSRNIEMGERGLPVQRASFKLRRLTRRETDVLQWVAEGKTNAEIGIILEMSPRTVQKHLQHIFEKLGVETRTAAATWAPEALSRSGSRVLARPQRPARS